MGPLVVEVAPDFRVTVMRFALLVLALATGHLATLSLWEAGPYVRYQHLAPIASMGSEHPLALFALALEIVVVFAFAIRDREAIRRFLRALPRLTIAMTALVAFGLGATLSRDPFVYVSELALAGTLILVHTTCLGLCVFHAPVAIHRAVERAAARWIEDPSPARRPGGIDRTALVAAAFVTVTAALLSTTVYERHPHVPDEVVYLYHARYLAAGVLDLPLPAVPSAFEVDLMHYEATRWFSPVPIGWPVVLAVGVALGVPWLVNPCLGGVSVLLLFALARELYGVRMARASALLAATSPWLIFLSMSYMTHLASLVAMLVGCVAAARLRRSRAARDALLAGAGVGVLSLIRPLEGVAAGVVLGLWVLAHPPWSQRLRSALLFGAGCVATAALVFPYNRAMTGDPTKFPIMLYTDKVYGPKSNAMGFGPERGLGWTGLDPRPGHDLLDVFINANLNLFSIEIELWGWCIGSLAPLVVLATTKRARRIDLALAAAGLWLAAIHGLYWFSGGPDFGARYWFLAIVPLVLLTTRGLACLAEALRAMSPRSTTGIGIAVALVAGLTLTTYLPWRALDKYRHFRGMRGDLRTLTEDPAFARALVLVRGRRHPDYASALVYNPIDFRAASPLFAWDRGPSVTAALLQAYPERSVYVVDGPSRTGEGFALVAGPLQAPSEILGWSIGESPR